MGHPKSQSHGLPVLRHPPAGFYEERMVKNKTQPVQN